MHYLRFIFLGACLLFIKPISHAQLLGGPEATAKAFVRALGKGNYQKAAGYCILEMGHDMQRDIDRMYRRGPRYRLQLFNCQSVETPQGVECECESYVEGRYSVLSFDMTEVDGNWKIYDLNVKENREKNDRKKDERIKDQKKSSAPGTPTDVLVEFVAYNKEGNYKKAESITIMSARGNLRELIATDPGKLPVSISNVDCYETYDGYKTACNCSQQTASGKEESAYYELALVDGKWKIIDYAGGTGAEQTVVRFVKSMAAGNCEAAKNISTGNASENVQGSIDAGCAEYHTLVLNVNCYTEGDTTFCVCTEERDGMEMTFNYSMVSVNGRWLVADYQKDLALAEEENDVYEEAVAIAQVDPVQEQIATTVTAVLPDVEASYPGGKAALQKYLQENLLYPVDAKDAGFSGPVYVMFIVSENGIISHARVVKGVHVDLDAEAMRLIYAMPTWVPGTLDGKNVASYFTLAVNFKLEE